MSSVPTPSSEDLARYLEARGELGKPWMWHLLRLTKLKESKDSMAPDEFLASLHEAHADLMQIRLTLGRPRHHPPLTQRRHDDRRREDDDRQHHQ